MNARMPAPVASVELVPLRSTQLDAVVRVEQSAYTHPWTRGNFEDSLHSGYHMQTLLQGDDLLGYLVAMRGVDEMHLLNLTVAPAHQCQGWGRYLLEALVAHTRARGVPWLWLEVRASNARALSLYQRHGFARVGERKNYYPANDAAREDAVVMSLKL